MDALSLPGKENSRLSNNYRNSEGYSDPTAGEALSRITANEKQSLRAFRPIVYICSPYSGDVEGNVVAARRYCRFAVEQGYIPIAPHLLFPQFLDDSRPDERELGLFFGNALMEVSNAEIWCECFGRNIADLKPSDSYAIAALMTQVDGWKRTTKRSSQPLYGRQRLYEREK